ncbi:MAG TPA: transporter [Terriglobales bacterium]
MRLALALAFLVLSFCSALAQDLSPRAYLITPIHSNAINLTYSYQSGSLQFTGSTPITGATANIHLGLVSYYHSLSFFKRSANFTAVLPYGIGNFQGQIKQIPAHVYRSGLLDSQYRLAVNLKGGPAMDTREFSQWHQTILIGASFTLVAPTGQYDPTKLVNLGDNRWGFKPEIGFSRRWGKWLLDAYSGAWFFTTNNEYFSHNQFNPGVATQSEKPVAEFETHLSYDTKPWRHYKLRMWASLDGNFWFGGQTSINGVATPGTNQRSSRLGATAAFPYTSRQSIKVSFSDGAYVLYGGNYKNVSIGWQYTWLGRPN